MPLPPLYELVIEASLYRSFALEDADMERLAELRGGNFQIDCYCLSCERETVHRPSRSTGGGSGRVTPPPDWMFNDGLIYTTIDCVRCCAEIASVFTIADRTLLKWGQRPSLADLAGAEMRQFRKILSKTDYDELNKAIGLNSHGIGIGSFVYLRRIFERIVSTYAEKSRESKTLPDNFNTLRMQEKIAALRDYLPEPVYEYREAYSILSRGIHELSEHDCRTTFPVILAAVRMMLEEEVRLRQRAQEAKELKFQFDAIVKDIRKSGAE